MYYFDGDTDGKGVNTTASVVGSNFSFLCWLKNANEFGAMPIAYVDENGSHLKIWYENFSANVQVDYSTTDGKWACVMDAYEWTCLAIAYEAGTSNDPAMYVRELGSSQTDLQTETVTEAQTPVGTIGTPNTGVIIGNNNAFTTFLGNICHVQFWNRALALNEFTGAMNRPGSIRNGLTAYWPLLLGGAGHASPVQNLTLSGLTTQRHGPPCCPVLYKPRRGRRLASAPSGPPKFLPEALAFAPLSGVR